MCSYDKIIMSSDNFLIPKIQLEDTPSRIHGLNKQDEKDLRILGCELIQSSGILLKLPQVVMATGQILFQRFYYSKSFIRYDVEIVATSCIFLASKIEESPRMIRDILNVFHHIKQIRGQKVIKPLDLEQYEVLKTRLLNAECLLLKTLGFCVHAKHTHKLILTYLQLLGLEKNKQLMQCAWNFMNDSLRTEVFVRYKPEVIASACIYLAGRKIQLPLPNSPPWYGLFNVEENDIIDVSYLIMELYNRPKLNFEELELSVKKLKTIFNETRTRERLAQERSTISTSTSVKPAQPLTTTTAREITGFISRSIPTIIEAKTVTKTKRFHSRPKSRTLSKNRKKSKRSPSRSKIPADNNNNDKRISRNRVRSPPSPRSRTSAHYNNKASRSDAGFHSLSRSRTSSNNNNETWDSHARSPLSSSSKSYSSRYSDRRTKRDGRSPGSNTHRLYRHGRHMDNGNKERSRYYSRYNRYSSNIRMDRSR